MMVCVTTFAIPVFYTFAIERGNVSRYNVFFWSSKSKLGKCSIIAKSTSRRAGERWNGPKAKLSHFLVKFSESQICVVLYLQLHTFSIQCVCPRCLPVQFNIIQWNRKRNLIHSFRFRLPVYSLTTPFFFSFSSFTAGSEIPLCIERETKEWRRRKSLLLLLQT